MALPTTRRSVNVKNAKATQPHNSQSAATDVHPEETKSDNEDLYRQTIIALVKEFIKLRIILSHAEEKSHGIAQTFKHVGFPINGPRPAAELVEKEEREPRVTDPKWVQMALPGVGRVSIGKVAKGKAPVSIDGAKEFPLTPAPADILAVLLDVTETDEGGDFPMPRTPRELVAPYSARRGSPVDEHAVVMAISRLRFQLMTVGNVTPQLVETVPGRGVRFRIRRKKP